MRTHRQRTGVGACAVIGAVLAVAGCSGDGGDGGGGAVPEGLEGVRFTGAPPEGVTVVDVARADELLAADEERFLFLAEMGTPLLTHFTVPAHRYGLDPRNAETAVTIGNSDPYGFWWGDFDEAAITEDLEADGFAERDGGVWADEEATVRLRVSGDEIAWGGKGFDPAVLEEGETLADVPRYAALTECLGEEAYRADYVEGDADEAVTAWAVGQLAESAEQTSEVMCVATDGEASAESVAASLRQTIEENRERYGGAEVGVLEGEVPGVRVTVPHEGEDQRPGWVLRDDLDLILALNA